MCIEKKQSKLLEYTSQLREILTFKFCSSVFVYCVPPNYGYMDKTTKANVNQLTKVICFAICKVAKV